MPPTLWLWPVPWAGLVWGAAVLPPASGPDTSNPEFPKSIAAAMRLKDLTPWKRSYDKSRQNIKKQRHHFADKSPDSQSYGFYNSHVWMWELDHNSLAEYQRIDAFEPWCWRRLFRVPWTAKSILKEINPEYSLEGLMLKLKLQYFGHLMQRADSLEKILMLGKIQGRRRRGCSGWDG